MNQNKYSSNIPLDIDSIFNLDIEKWYNEFDFPIKWEEFLLLENDIKSILNKFIDKYPNHSNLIIINYKIFIEYTNFIFYLKLLNLTKRNISCSKDNEYVQSILNNEIPNKPIINFPNLKNSNYNSIKFRIKYFLKYMRDNKYVFPKIWKNKLFIMDESRNTNTLKHLQKEHKGQIYSLSFFDFYDSNYQPKINESNLNEITQISEKIINELNQVAKKNNLIFTDKQNLFLLNHTKNLFIKSYKVFLNVSKSIKNKKINLYIGCNNNYYTRILSVAIRENKGTIHSFRHGEPFNYLIDMTSWLDLSLCDYWYEYNDKNINSMKYALKYFPPPNKNKFKIRKMNNSKFQTFDFKIKSCKSDKISTVMLIGNFYRNFSFSAATSVFPTLQFYTELNIISFLQKKGYKVIYKIHPENKENIKYFFQKVCQLNNNIYKNFDVITDTFDKSIKYTDCFAYYYTATSTLFNAIESEKPIYFFDFGLRSFTPDIKKYINSRFTFKKPNKFNFVKIKEYLCVEL